MFYSFLRNCARLFYIIVYHIHVIGGENIPKEKGGYIIASNHVSNNDPPVVGITFKGKYTFMAKEELFEINPIFSWLISKLGGEGRIFVIFPEGTRSKAGALGRAKSGVTIIAAQAKVPVVPVYIQYGRKKFRQNIYISIGEKIPAKHFDVDISDRKMLKQVSSTIMDEIAKLRENMPDVD